LVSAFVSRTIGCTLVARQRQQRPRSRRKGAGDRDARISWPPKNSPDVTLPIMIKGRSPWRNSSRTPLVRYGRGTIMQVPSDAGPSIRPVLGPVGPLLPVLGTLQEVHLGVGTRAPTMTTSRPCIRHFRMKFTR